MVGEETMMGIVVDSCIEAGLVVILWRVLPDNVVSSKLRLVGCIVSCVLGGGADDKNLKYKSDRLKKGKCSFSISRNTFC